MLKVKKHILRFISNAKRLKTLLYVMEATAGITGAMNN